MPVARFLFGTLALAAMVTLLVVEGLSVTSGVIEVVMFVIALAGWVLLRPTSPGSATVKGVRSKKGKVVIKQTAGQTLAEDVTAATDASIDQRAQ